MTFWCALIAFVVSTAFAVLVLDSVVALLLLVAFCTSCAALLGWTEDL